MQDWLRRQKKLQRSNGQHPEKKQLSILKSRRSENLEHNKVTSEKRPASISLIPKGYQSQSLAAVISILNQQTK